MPLNARTGHHNGSRVRSSSTVRATRRILIYGFGPYGPYPDNITATIVGAIAAEKRYRTEVFPVRFSRSMIVNALAAARPDIVIGLGQHPRARKIRIERLARNRRQDTHDAAPRKIDPRGPLQLRVNLRLPRLPGTTVTYDAGSYVCNFSMYTALQWCAPRGARFGFLHIPRRIDPDAALAILQALIQALK